MPIYFVHLWYILFDVCKSFCVDMYILCTMIWAHYLSLKCCRKWVQVHANVFSRFRFEKYRPISRMLFGSIGVSPYAIVSFQASYFFVNFRYGYPEGPSNVKVGVYSIEFCLLISSNFTVCPLGCQMVFTVLILSLYVASFSCPSISWWRTGRSISCRGHSQDMQVFVIHL